MARRKRSFRLVVLLVASVLLPAAGCSTPKVQRHGTVIGIPKENIAEYKRLHAETWPGVLKMIHKTNIRNYSIYLGEVDTDQYYLFGYYEHVGGDYEADMAKMKKDKTTQEWWKHTDPLQEPLPSRKQGEWWAQWEEVFHDDGPAYDKSRITSRHGAIIGMPAENILAYTQMHAAVWPGVLAAITRANIRNYSIYLGQIRPGEYLLFSYFEYIGEDFAGDMEGIADEVTKAWWTYTDPLQVRLPGTPQGEQWKTMEELFHTTEAWDNRSYRSNRTYYLLRLSLTRSSAKGTKLC
jgi:L-rhamnose mutarotase